LGISEKVKQEALTGDLPQGLIRISDLEVSLPQSVPEQCYVLEMPNIAEEPEGSLGIFRCGGDVSALYDIYALGLAGKKPFVCKVIKNDARDGSSHHGELSQDLSASRRKNPRKSFMTPTPLHIPESRVSPIPDSAHEMIYLKGLSDSEALKVVPLQDVVWIHPLVFVLERPPGQSSGHYSKTK